MVTQRGPRDFHVTIVNISHLREDKTWRCSNRGPQFSLGGLPTWKLRVVSRLSVDLTLMLMSPPDSYR